MFHATLIATLVMSTLIGCDSEPEATTTTDGRVEIRVDGEGYHPDRVEAQAGQPLTLVFTRADANNCGEELVIASEDIRRELPVGEAVEVTFTPSEAGEVRFACGMDMYRGTVVVR